MACRRCDDCGIRTEVKSDDDDRCILQCSLCGKEYPFYKSPREDRLDAKMKEKRNIAFSQHIRHNNRRGRPGWTLGRNLRHEGCNENDTHRKGAPGGQMAINKGIENYPGFME